MPPLRELALAWYTILGGMYAAVALPLRQLLDAAGVPALSALLFGVIGAAAPCQLSTGAGALAFLTRRAAGGRSFPRDTLAYVAGRVLVYTLLGALVVVAGREAIPVQALALVRRLVGPAMLLMGLNLLRLLPLVRPSVALGQSLSNRLAAHHQRAGVAGGAGGAFLLGVAFSFAFCPTLFLIFFVLTLPLAVTSPAGAAYPALFAVGTTLPLLAMAGLVAGGALSPRVAAGGVRRLRRWLRPAAGAALVLAGLHDTVLYWLL